jgi:hypothetical protein
VHGCGAHADMLSVPSVGSRGGGLHAGPFGQPGVVVTQPSLTDRLPGHVAGGRDLPVGGSVVKGSIDREVDPLLKELDHPGVDMQ